MNYKQMSTKKLKAVLENATDEETRNAIQMELDTRAVLNELNAVNASTKVAALKVAEVVKCIDSHLSEVTNNVLRLMDAIPYLDSESLDKLEEQLTNDWDDSPIFEHVRDYIMAVIDSYHQDRVLKPLKEKFGQLKNLESDYTVLHNDCLELLGRLNDKSLKTINIHRYHSAFIDNIIDAHFTELERRKP